MESVEEGVIELAVLPAEERLFADTVVGELESVYWDSSQRSEEVGRDK